MKATMRQGSLGWLRKTKDYRPKDGEAQPTLFDMATPHEQHEPYTDDESKLIIATYIKDNPAIENEEGYGHPSPFALTAAECSPLFLGLQGTEMPR